MLVDSFNMTIKDRGVILRECTNAKDKKTVITYGTNKMTETAKFLAKGNLKKQLFLLKQ